MAPEADRSAALSEKRMWEIARLVAHERTAVAAGLYRNPTLEITPSGHIRYAATGSHVKVIAEMVSEVYVASGDTARLDYAPALDVDGAVTTGASWAYTAPENGFYMFHSGLLCGADDSGWVAGDKVSLGLIVNGSFINYNFLDYHDIPVDISSIVHHEWLEGTCTFPLHAGDEAYIQFANDSSATRRLFQPSRLVIWKL